MDPIDYKKGLGLLYQLPGDVRRLLYHLQGMCYRMCIMSKAIRTEVAPVVDKYRQGYSISGREVVRYLEEVTRVPLQRFLMAGVFLDHIRDVVSVRNVFHWEIATTSERGEGRAAVRVTNLEEARRERREQQENPEVNKRGLLRSIREKKKEEWFRLLEVLRGSEYVLPRHRYGIEILMRRMLHEHNVEKRREYAWKHYLFMTRRVLEYMMRPTGYSLSHFLGCRLVSKSLCYEETERVSRLSKELAEEKRGPLMELSRQLASVYRYSLGDLRVLHVAGSTMDDRVLRHIESMTFHALRHLTCRGYSRSKVKIKPPTGKNIRDHLVGMLSRGKCSVTLKFCELGKTEVEMYTIKLDDRPDGSKVVWMVESGDDELPGEWTPLEESNEWADLLGYLDEHGDDEMVVNPSLGRKLYATDREYGRVLRDQMRRSAVGLNVSVEDLLGNADDGYMNAKRRRASLVVDLDTVGPYTEEISRRVSSIRELYAIVTILVSGDSRTRNARTVAENLLKRMDELGTWTLLNL